MRKLSTLLAVAAVTTFAACGGSAEVPKDVDVDVQTDTVPMPDVDVNARTDSVTVPVPKVDVDVNRGGTDTTRRDTTRARPPQ
jgi:predicted small lipoprotein YifL